MKYLVHYSFYGYKEKQTLFDWAWYNDAESLKVGIDGIKSVYAGRELCFHSIDKIPMTINVMYSRDGRVVEQDL